MSNGKGSVQRPHNVELYARNHVRTFGAAVTENAARRTIEARDLDAHSTKARMFSDVVKAATGKAPAIEARLTVNGVKKEF